MNIYLFIDYYCIKLDEYDYFDTYFMASNEAKNQVSWIKASEDVQTENRQRIEKYFVIFLIILGIATVLTIIFYGFAVNLYYYEKEALKKKQEKWRRRMNEAFESQGVAPDVATAIADDVLSGKNCQIIMPNK